MKKRKRKIVMGRVGIKIKKIILKLNKKKGRKRKTLRIKREEVSKKITLKNKRIKTIKKKMLLKERTKNKIIKYLKLSKLCLKITIST